MSDNPNRITDRVFVRRTLIFLALTGLAILLWQLKAFLLLIFGAVLVAVIFRSIADPIRRLTGLPDGLAVAIAVLLLIGILGGASWLFGNEVSAQARQLSEIVPDAWRSLESRLGESGLGERIQGWAEDAAPSGSGVLAGAGRFATSLVGGIADALIVLAGGIYLAAQPHLYRKGLLTLFPEKRRPVMTQALDESGQALRLWLKGQLISMAVIGIVTGLGLWLIGVPSALVLGILAGLLEFIPLIGPILAAIPAILIALAVSPTMAAWTLGLYVVVQQLEGNVLQPVVQQYAVDLPAVLLLFALLGFGILFGALGIILAAPLTVVIYVLVKRLYVREVLGTPTPMPGEDDNQQ